MAPGNHAGVGLPTRVFPSPRFASRVKFTPFPVGRTSRKVHSVHARCYEVCPAVD